MPKKAPSTNLKERGPDRLSFHDLPVCSAIIPGVDQQSEAAAILRNAHAPLSGPQAGGRRQVLSYYPGSQNRALLQI